MMTLDINLFMTLFVCSCLVYVFYYKHVLLILMSLEFVVMNLLVEMFYVLGYESMYYFTMYFLVFAVCESILGLSILIVMVRFSGNDYVDSSLVSKW